jgi:DNA-binding Lrp family transcriptional regulator
MWRDVAAARRGKTRLQGPKARASLGRATERPPMTTCVFVQIRCKPGTTYAVADAISLKEIHSEMYSTSGEWDLLMKIYIPDGADVGHFINEALGDVPQIERSMTTLTFKAF